MRRWRSSTAAIRRGSRRACRRRPRWSRSRRRSSTWRLPWHGVIDRDALRARLGSVVLLDARAGPRYRGEIEPIDPVAGHIPTARNAPTDGNLAEGGRFLAPSELAARFAALGADGSEDGRHVVRQRRVGDAQRAGDARGRPPRPDPLRRFVQRLVDGRLPGRDGPRSGRSAGVIRR